jgi:hypothetical protein
VLLFGSPWPSWWAHLAARICEVAGSFCSIRWPKPQRSFSFHSPPLARLSCPLRCRSLASCVRSLTGTRRSAAVRMAGPGCAGQSRPSSPSGPWSPTPSGSEEVSSPAPTAEQTDPFECCFANPCPRCAFYQRRWRTTCAGRESSMASDGAGGGPAAAGSPSRRSTGQRGGSARGGSSARGADSGNSASNNSSPNKLRPNTPVSLA